MSLVEGRIYKGIGGFYYVMTRQGLVECKPRGLFRKQGIKPLAGDRVELAEEAETLFIDTILPRKNAFVRPPVANVDQLFLVASTTEPSPSFLVLDTLSAVAIDQNVEPVLVVTKNDLAPADKLREAYRGSGIPVLEVQVETGQGLEQLRERLAGRLSVFSGNSGVGKSTLLNALLPHLQRETGDISKKLGRGRHTTREVELFEVAEGLLADTPGFASFDLQRASPISKENLQLAFPEIKSRMPDCRFSGCAHTGEAGCAVKKAVDAGDISATRYESYKTLYQDAKQQEKY